MVRRYEWDTTRQLKRVRIMLSIIFWIVMACLAFLNYNWIQLFINKIF